MPGLQHVPFLGYSWKTRKGWGVKISLPPRLGLNNSKPSSEQAWNQSIWSIPDTVFYIALWPGESHWPSSASSNIRPDDLICSFCSSSFFCYAVSISGNTNCRWCSHTKLRNAFQVIPWGIRKTLYLKGFWSQKKDLQAPWICKGLKKSSEQKQKLYINFLKDKLIQNEQIGKNYNYPFEKLRKNVTQRIVKMTWNAQSNERNHKKRLT